MSFQFRLVIRLWIAILAVLTLVGCQPPQVDAPPTNTSGALTPFWTDTPGPTATPSRPAGTPTATAIPATIPPPPTPTPFTYVVEKGDTMGVIAYRFGVTVADLKAANPEVDPNLMSVGSILVIPIIEKNEAGTPEALATPTPVPLELGQPVCYPVASGGSWCLAQVHNDQSQPLENLIAWMQLVSPQGETLTGQQAIPPLNLLPAGQSLPVMAFFTQTVLTNITPRVELLSALAVPSGDQRYRPVDLQIEQTEIDPDGLQATVRGTLTLLAIPTPKPPADSASEGTPPATPTATPEGYETDDGHARQIWLAVCGYDADDQPVGVRKWEIEDDLAPGATLSFDLAVFSLGPEITRVEVLVEAHP